jgi:hypothetical protein
MRLINFFIGFKNNTKNPIRVPRKRIIVFQTEVRMMPPVPGSMYAITILTPNNIKNTKFR